MNCFQLNSHTRITRQRLITGADDPVSIIESIMQEESQLDDFASPTETSRTVWFLSVRDVSFAEVLDQWQEMNHSDFALECLHHQTREGWLYGVFPECEEVLNVEKLDEEAQADLVSSLFYACSELHKECLVFKQWGTFNVVRQGNAWKILPTPGLQKDRFCGRSSALQILASWLRSLGLPLLRKEPANSILTMVQESSLPEELYNELSYPNFWLSLENFHPPMRTVCSQTDSQVTRSWSPEYTKVGFCCLKDNVVLPGNRLLWYKEIRHFGDDFRRNLVFHPRLDSERRTLSWHIPADQTRYETFRVVPLVKYDENWVQTGVPFQVGGPEDMRLLEARFDLKTREIVLNVDWSLNPDIQCAKIIFRTDRFAENAHDIGSLGVEWFYRERINHPFRVRKAFPASLYIVVFSVVRMNNRNYYSTGQSSRKQLQPQTV